GFPVWIPARRYHHPPAATAASVKSVAYRNESRTLHGDLAVPRPAGGAVPASNPRAAIVAPSRPASTRAGYLTPSASPVRIPARTAVRASGRPWNRDQATTAAVPNAASDTSFNG